jgi:DNA-binding transcriptional ArsR family regulator
VIDRYSEKTEPRRHLVGPSVPPTPDQILRGLNHPRRRRILRALHKAGEARSASEIAKAIRVELKQVTHHFKVLKECGVIALTDSRPVRGSVERFYASTVTGDKPTLLFLDSSEGHDEGP